MKNNNILYIDMRKKYNNNTLKIMKYIDYHGI